MQPAAIGAGNGTQARYYSSYGIANLLFVPTPFFKVGIEYQYGALQLLDERHAGGSRFQFTVQSKF